MNLHRPIIDETYLPIFAQHDMACPVCHDKPAVLCCGTMVFRPCWSCQQKGWRTQKHNLTFLKVQRWYARNGDDMKTFLFFVCFCLLTALLLPSCPKQCKPKMARCQGTTAQLCRPDGKWTSVVDCSKVDKVPWSCACLNTVTCRCKKPVDLVR